MHIALAGLNMLATLRLAGLAGLPGLAGWLVEYAVWPGLVGWLAWLAKSRCAGGTFFGNSQNIMQDSSNRSKQMYSNFRYGGQLDQSIFSRFRVHTFFCS